MELFLGFINFGGVYDYHNYLEVEISPHNVLFYSKIFNPNLNCTNLEGSLQQCAGSGLKWDAGIEDVYWWVYLQVPFYLLGAPGGATQLQAIPYTWKGNFFRIDILNDVREFSCWSPTYTSPACFHRPEYFGDLSLKFSN